MADRIARHRAQRPSTWVTVEAPVELRSAVISARPGDYLVVDCLTLWVSNLLGTGWPGNEIVLEAQRLANDLRSRRSVVVSNEVGMGIVPANELARLFGDTL